MTRVGPLRRAFPCFRYTAAPPSYEKTPLQISEKALTMTSWWQGALRERNLFSKSCNSSQANISFSKIICSMESRKSTYGSSDSLTTATLSPTRPFPRRFLTVPLVFFSVFFLGWEEGEEISSSKKDVAVVVEMEEGFWLVSHGEVAEVEGENG